VPNFGALFSAFFGNKKDIAPLVMNLEEVAMLFGLGVARDFHGLNAATIIQLINCILCIKIAD